MIFLNSKRRHYFAGSLLLNVEDLKSVLFYHKCKLAINKKADFAYALIFYDATKKETFSLVSRDFTHFFVFAFRLFSLIELDFFSIITVKEKFVKKASS